VAGKPEYQPVETEQPRPERVAPKKRDPQKRKTGQPEELIPLIPKEPSK
jgi:hypothetical protein